MKTRFAMALLLSFSLLGVMAPGALASGDSQFLITPGVGIGSIRIGERIAEVLMIMRRYKRSAGSHCTLSSGTPVLTYIWQVGQFYYQTIDVEANMLTGRVIGVTIYYDSRYHFGPIVPREDWAGVQLIAGPPLRVQRWGDWDELMIYRGIAYLVRVGNHIGGPNPGETYAIGVFQDISTYCP